MRGCGVLPTPLAQTRTAIARHPVAAFLILGIGVLAAFALISPLLETQLLPFDLPLFGVLGGTLGVGLAAFVVTAATDGRAGVHDLARRSLRWRVPLRWYLVALFGVPIAATLLAIAIYGTRALESPPDGWARALGAVGAVFVLQLVLFQLPEEIGWTGFLQDRWQDRYTPLKLSAMVALPWAVWHLPDFFVDEGLGIEQLLTAPVFLVIEFISLFFARVLIVWLYARTGRSVFLVAIFHASFDASISELSYDIVPGSNAARVVILSAVIVIGALAVIAATRGQFGDRRSTPVEAPTTARTGSA
jgi:membrane protease YdiL (CAAX protease family)